MAGRAQPINKSLAFAGSAAILVVALLVILPVGALFLRAEASNGLDNYDWSVIRFTVFQAALSALISVALAIPVARALARRRFRGRRFVLLLMGAPFLLPSIVAVFGLLAVWGRSGVVSDILTFFGASKLDIYGLPGILLAHVFFNFPLAVRMILQAWDAIPAEHFRLAAQLNMSPRATFRIFEIPLLRGVLPAAILVIFLLCMTSFAVILAMGGGPKATTIELAIYQALRFEFDLSGAAILALVQFGLCLSLAIVALKITRIGNFGQSLSQRQLRWNRHGFSAYLDGTILTLALAFIVTPLIAILYRGATGLFYDMPTGVFAALILSISIALVSALLSLVLALVLGHLICGLNKKPARTVEVFTFLSLAASPFVIGTGLFIVINPFFNPFALALPVTALVNTAITLPLTLRIVLPALQRSSQNFGNLAQNLGLLGWTRFRLLTWPQIRPEVGFACGIAAALSMGDLGVITLFAPPEMKTLPLLMYNLMGSYQTQAAASVALVLVASSFALFWIFDAGGRRDYRLK